MNITPTRIDGIHIIEPRNLKDERGAFVKIFHKDTFVKPSLQTDFKESYYSISKKNVMRGMHFQIPPEDHAKLVYVTRGAILDVVLDIRKGSPTYGQYIAIELSAKNAKTIYVDVGFAHGFLSLANHTTVTYMQTTMHSPEHDHGIHLHSFGMQWNVEKPIMSPRDANFPHFAKFYSPFTYHKPS